MVTPSPFPGHGFVELLSMTLRSYGQKPLALRSGLLGTEELHSTSKLDPACRSFPQFFAGAGHLIIFFLLRGAMSKYGTIPTSSSSSDPPPPSSSPLDYISRAKARGASALASRRPWREFADPRALSVPRGCAAAYRRARANLAHFSANYALTVLLVVFLSLLWEPISLLVFLACMVAWLVLYFLRDEPLALCGRAVGEGVVLAFLATVTLLLLLLTGATVNILTSLLVGLVVVLIHALLHRAADSIDEEAGRWYTPVPPSTAY
ncbi:hypothetical protein PR202_ga11529 [Eleusine coracana subsp. coracana]|uniref:PRA1 family protein n=1 Tax=Eleusine coracana subsp. coracana TaxID=191504 RepID=A0AAV5C9U8_ELECO|nr:hypothetical protein PR202_ga11529 [Eleusine coracana subsp. coracana]